MGTVFNAAKESALDGFIGGQIGFTEMAGVVEGVMGDLWRENGLIDAGITLDNVAKADQLARIKADERMKTSA